MRLLALTGALALLAPILAQGANAPQIAFAEGRFAESGFAESRFAESRFAESRLAASATAPVRTSRAGQPRARPASQAFWEAVKLDDVRAMQNELLRGSDANARHPEFGPAIIVAARERSYKTLAYLAGLAGTAVDATNANGETALMIVCLNGDLDNAKLLVSRGAQINRPGWTPLHYAASGGNLEVIQYLLDNNAYIDAQSPNGTTPLMMAARQKQTSAAYLLVEAGADPTQRNEAGLSAADYLERQGELADAQWMREQSGAFLRRYGTVERPRRADGSRVAPGSAGSPAPLQSGSVEGAGSTEQAGRAGGEASELPQRVDAPGQQAGDGVREQSVDEPVVGPITTPVKPPPRLPGMRD